MVLLYLSLLLMSNCHLFTSAMYGGAFVSIKSVPYQVLLYTYQPSTDSYSSCGATIISRHWLISAGHCVDKFRPSNLLVYVGITTTSRYMTALNATTIIVSSNYNSKTSKGDISLIKLKTAIEFNEYVQPIPFSRNTPKTGDLVVISGFGDSHYNLYGPHLKKATVPVIDIEKCKEKRSDVSDNVFCTDVSRVDLCFGDSGGPAVQNGELVGIISLGCDYIYPNVYTNVASYYDWIVRNTDIQRNDFIE